MNSRREYEMLFQLNAQMGSSFTNTFNKVQQQFISMQKDIQALNKLQSDISAYQKQQSAVEATKQKLANLQQQYDNIQKEIKETEGYSSSLENKLLSKQQQIDKTSASLKQQTDRLNQMGDALRTAGVNTDNLTQESRRLESEIVDLKEQQEALADSSEDFGESGVQAFEAIQQAIAAAGVAKALKEIYDEYMDCITIAGDFGEAMSNVEALSGASAEEMDALTAKAKELGATTKFTAQQSADAMGYMAMAGWDASEMLSGMDGVLQLAAASGEDLALVADIVTDNLTAFGLKASDTGRFADVLAAAATKSNTSVSIMGETFKQSASIAGALGYSIEDVAVGVGLMANSGIKGSLAGTALKNTFNGLLEGVTLTSDAFGEYAYSAVKADGTMKSFADTIDELRYYFEQMSEAERVSNAMAIAGSRSYNGLLAIINATDEDYASLAASINNCSGAASKMAAIKLDNLNGDLALMDSAVEALETSIGEEFTPEMRELYSVGTDILQQLNSFVQEEPGMVKAGATFIGIVGTATAGLTAYAAIAKVAKALNLAALFTGPAGTALAATAAIAGVVSVIVGLSAAASEGVPALNDLTEAAQAMNEVMEESASVYDDTVSSTQAAATVADTYITKLEELQAEQARLKAAGQDTSEVDQEYHNTLAILCQVVPELADCIDLETDAIAGGTAALRANTEAWKENAIAQAYQDKLTSMYEKYSDVLIEAEQNSIGLTRAQTDLEAASKKYDAALAKRIEMENAASQAAAASQQETGTVSNALNFLGDEYYALCDEIEQYEKEIETAQRTADNYQKAIDADAEAVAAATDEISLAEEAVKNLTSETERAGVSAAETARQEQELQAVISDVTARAEELAEAYSEAYNAAFSSVSGQYQLWDKAASTVATSAETINKSLQSQVSYWQNYNANLESLGNRAADIEGLSEMLASFADGSADSVNAVAGMASASDADLEAMVKNWKALQTEQKNVADSIAELATDFDATMEELQEELAADIEAMDLGDEAAESAQATIQGFIDGAVDMLPQVQIAYAAIAQAAADALYSVSVPSVAKPGTTRSVNPNLTTSTGYAEGTLDAQPGWHKVGERGPEYMYMGGGEVVLPADISASIDRGSYNGGGAYGGLNVQITFQINGNVTNEAVDRLYEFGDDFAERVRQVIEDVNSDSMRRAYS